MNEDGQGVYAMRTKEIVNSLCMIHAYNDPLAVQCTCMCKAVRCIT